LLLEAVGSEDETAGVAVAAGAEDDASDVAGAEGAEAMDEELVDSSADKEG
jgi:hypothetical protein